MEFEVQFLNIKPHNFFKLLYLLSTHKYIRIKDNDMYREVKITQKKNPTIMDNPKKNKLTFWKL